MKKLIALLLILILTAGTFPALAEDNITVLVNNQEVLFDAQPFIENDRVMVPIRAISEALDIKVTWDELNQLVTGYVEDREYLYIKVGSNAATVGLTSVETDVAPLIKEDRVFIPLRFFSEAFDANVFWNQEKRVVEITTHSLFNMALDKTFKLLDGRLSISMPTDSVTYANVSTNKFSQVLSPDVLGTQLIVSTEEQFLQSSGDLKEDVRNLGDFEPSSEIIQRDGFELISYADKALDDIPCPPDSNAICPFEQYLLKDEHGMLIKLDFLSPCNSGTRDSERYHQLAFKILDSLKIIAPLNTAPHSQSVNNFNIPLLEGYGAYSLLDTEMAIQKITTTSNAAKAPYIHIYRNIENNEMNEHSDKDDLKLSREVDGYLIGYKVKWQIYSDGTMYAETKDERISSIPYSLYGFAETEADQNDMIKMAGMIKFLPSTGAKPVIYLYPETETEVSVDLQLTGDFTFTYPQYNNGWKVTARPDGTILSNGKEYSYLFWEGIFEDFPVDFKEGFVIKGSESAEFLQQVLSKMGLTPKEYNEFIVYWAPKMQENEYNKVYFAKEEYEEAAKLTISPTPDSILRVFMVYEKAEEGTVLPPQKIESFERKGFTVVEWGGRQVGSNG